MVNNNFTIRIDLQNYMFKHKILNKYTSNIIDEIKRWYNINIEHFFKSSHITSFELYHIKDNIFMINFSYDTLTLPFIEENLTNPDIFGKNPLQLGDNKYFVIGRKYDDLDDLDSMVTNTFKNDNEDEITILEELNLCS